MTMARALGLTRVGAARFSFLLAVPGIAMAGGWEFLKLVTGPGNGADWPMMGLGIAVSAVTGYLCIHVLLKFITRIGLLPFALYRLALAALIVLMLG
jgi:undecaprenyl-diphosphatase